MSIEELLSKHLAATEKLINVTEQLINLRVEGLAKVNEAAAAPAPKKTTTKPAAEAPAAASTPAAEPAAPAEAPAAPAGLTEIDVRNIMSAYVMHGSPDADKDKAEIDARKAEIFKLYDIVGAKLTPPREPGKTKLGDIPAEKYSALVKRITALTEELVAKGGRLVQAAAASDDDL